MADQTDDNELQALIVTLQNGVRAINALNVTLGEVFPQVASLANSAGSASGQFAVVTFGGVTYKINLLAVS
jgi:hypothetical protein